MMHTPVECGQTCILERPRGEVDEDLTPGTESGMEKKITG